MARITIPLLVAATCLATALPASARDPVPRTLEEAKARMATAERFTRSWPGHRHPPGNVRVEDYMELFGDRVMVSSTHDRLAPGRDDVKIIFIGRDGRYEWCTFTARYEGREYVESLWEPDVIRRRGREFPVLANGRVGQKPWQYAVLSPLYDGATGGIVWYTLTRGMWWDWNDGHLQERLPAVTWTLCPDFPSAEELGVGVNTAQTAIGYADLVAQDPGRRVLRPDLVTPDVARRVTAGR